MTGATAMLRPVSIVGVGALAVLGAGAVALLLVGTDGDGGRAPEASVERSVAEQPAAEPEAADGSAASEVEPPNAIARQASEWGISRCAQEIALVSEFLTRNTVFSARSMRGPREPDAEMFSSTIAARSQEDGAENLSTMSVVPVSGGRCNVVYETTAHFPNDCEAVHSARFANFVEPIEFGGLARAFATPGGDGQLYMLRTGEGCLVKKTQVLY